MSPIELKKVAHSFCEEFINSRLDRIFAEIEKIKNDLNSETKSTAGDKHETGRAMLQLEREKLGAQLSQAEMTKKVLEKVPVDSTSEKISLGSLVKTNGVTYFISISAGKCESGDDIIFCISPSTPIGKLLLGKSENESICFNGIEQIILKVD